MLDLSGVHRYARPLPSGWSLSAHIYGLGFSVNYILNSSVTAWPVLQVLTALFQVDIIAAYGERLLEWLQKYTFPAESKFAAASHATACADFFVKELLRNGTTCALAFCTVHAGSVDALLERAADAGMMMICGKVLLYFRCVICDAPKVMTCIVHRS
jgi:hypothetical protein